MEFKVSDLGLIDFQKALSLQKQVHLKVKEGLLEGALLICSHYPVMTAGRRAKKESLLVTEKELRERGVGLRQVERGGGITYHGPGQLTAYPIFNLGLVKKDIHLFLRKLEEVATSFLIELGIAAERRHGLTGVWIGGKKIASIGISIKNWITFHGLTINIKSSDLGNFRLIKPCGMDIEMTSAEDILGANLEIADLKEGLVSAFKKTFC
jgi:lipoate-protein ligase B